MTAAAKSYRRSVFRGFAGTLAVMTIGVSDPRVRAEGAPTGEPRTSLSLAVGPAFNYETRSFSGGSPGASYTGWAPVLDIAVGRQVRPRLVLAGDLQLAAVINRTESFLGGSQTLSDTLHFLDSLSGIADYTFWRCPRLHVGGGIGLLVTTTVDTHMGSVGTDLGFALSIHAGYQWPLRRGWSIGVTGRLTFYGFGSETPPPASSSVGLLPVVLLTFAR